MRQLTDDILVSTSQLWETNTGIISGPQGTILVDPGIFEPEFEAIAAAAGPIAAGFSTHAHWDHILWHRSLGIDVPRFATPETILLIEKDRERILRNLSATEVYLAEPGRTDGSELWDRTQLFKEQPLSWGEGSIAGLAVEILPVPGHEDGQAALVLPEYGVCFVADTLSDIEIPSVKNGSRSIALYLETLNRLQTVIDRVDWIVPGHGAPADPLESQRRLDADRRYLEALEPAVKAAPEDECVDDIARRIITDLGEERAQSELAWSMHLENIQQLVDERKLIAGR